MGLGTDQKFSYACTLLNQVIAELRETYPEAYLVASEGRLLAFTGAHFTVLDSDKPDDPNLPRIRVSHTDKCGNKETMMLVKHTERVLWERPIDTLEIEDWDV